MTRTHLLRRTALLLALFLPAASALGQSADTSAVVTHTEAAMRQSRQMILATPKEEQPLAAAVHFLGWYQANGKVITDACGALGVDATPYLSAFNARFATEHEHASRIFIASGMQQSVFDTAMARGQADREAGARRSIHVIAITAGNLTDRQACELLRNIPDRFVALLDYAKMYPDVAAVLMAN